MNKKISIVIPCHDEEDNVKPIVEAIKKYIPDIYDTEFVIVNDGSKDMTEAVIAELALNDKNIKGISLKRNFGHQAALICGIKYTTGDAVITMDGDFQHPPEKIPELIENWANGYDLVVCKKETQQKDALYREIARIIGYKLYEIIGDKNIKPGVSDFRIMDKLIVDALNSLDESRYILRGLTMLYAKNPKHILYVPQERRSGQSAFTFQQLYKLYVSTLTSFSLKPLKFAMGLGLALIFLSFLYLGYVIYVRLFHGQNVIQGFSALIFVNITLFGFLFFYLGVLSEYIGTIFDEVKHRPKYIIHKKYNIE